MAALTFASLIIGVLLTSHEAMAMTTVDPVLEECRQNSRPSITGNSNQYDQLVGEEWVTRNCQDQSLEWVQEECKCLQPLAIRQAICDYTSFGDGEFSRQFQQIQTPHRIFLCAFEGKLFWNQTGCMCDWIPGVEQTIPVKIGECETILATTFDTPQDTSMVHFVPWQSGAIPISNPAGANGMALFSQFTTGMFTIYKVGGSDFGTGFAIDFRFKTFDDQGTRNSFIPLITNGCSWADETYGIRYRSSDKTYSVALKYVSTVDRSFATANFMCVDTAASDGFQWNQVGLSYADGVVTLTVNGAVCLGDVIADSKPHTPNCPLIIGADYAAPERLFGFVDELQVRRYCQGPVIAPP